MEQNEPTDADLVARTLAGDGEAFCRLYDRYARMVRAVVGGVSLDWPAVGDMTQERFLRAYRKIGTLEDQARFGAWIAGIARQVARERKRSLQRDRHEFFGEYPLKMHLKGMRPAKLDGGRYQVIYGDLHSESVSADRLKAVEGR